MKNPYTSKTRRSRRSMPGGKSPKRRVRRYPSKAAFAKGSFRVVRSGPAKIVVGCPRGKYQKRKQHCTVGLRPYRAVRNTSRRAIAPCFYHAIRRGGRMDVFRVSAGRPKLIARLKPSKLAAWAKRKGISIA